MAGHPLRPATDRRLGGPLPRQLANQTRVHLTPKNFSHCTMRYCALLRYEQSFLPVIPLYEAGYPRVTHPSATQSISLPSENFHLIASFDLHVLGTPPAFILSQDQTLMFNLLVQNLLAFTNYFNPCPKSVSRILDFRAAPRMHMQACHSPRYSRILLFKVLFSEFLPDEMTFHLMF